MTTRKRKVASVLFTGTAAAATTGFAAPSTFAQQSNWAISPGGHYTMQLAPGTTMALNDVLAGVMVCSAASASGSLQSSGAANPIGSVSNATFGSTDNPCYGAFGTRYAANLTGSPWDVSALSYNSTTGVTHGQITGIDLAIEGVGNNCHAVVSGSAPFSYTNSTGVLRVLGEPTLIVKSVSICPFLGFFSGHKVEFGSGSYSPSYAVSPPQTIVHS